MANSNGWGDGAANNSIGWGQGSNNAIGWGDVYADSWAGLTDISGAPSVDPDAQAFITAASITDPTQQSAINQLVVDLKGYSIWSKMKALYPFVGGTASAHKWNLKDPRDLDAAFRLVFSGGWTHNSNGITGNGVNTTANTKLVNNAHLTSTSGSFGFYLRNTQSANVYDFSPGGFFGIALYIDTRYYMYGGTTSVSGLPSPAFYGLSRVGGTHKGYRNGVVDMTSTSAASLNAGEFSFTTNLRNYAFGYIAEGLTDAENTNFYTAVQAFQTTIGRSIGTQTVSDADAQAFVTNAGIIDQVEANAINNLVIGLKADSLWTKMKAVYPFVGGTASTHKFNLKNPLDTNAAFRLVFSGGWTHSSTGATPNGTNAYADTYFNQTTNFTSTSNASIGCYLRTNNATTGADMGAGDTGSSRQGMLIFSSFSGTYYGCAMGDTFIAPAPTNTDSRGFYSVVRNSGIQSLHKRGNITLNVSETEAVGTITNENIWVGGGTSGGYNYSSRETAFNFIGDALTQTEIDNYYSRVQTFQTSLNRNI